MYSKFKIGMTLVDCLITFVMFTLQWNNRVYHVQTICSLLFIKVLSRQTISSRKTNVAPISCALTDLRPYSDNDKWTLRTYSISYDRLSHLELKRW